MRTGTWVTALVTALAISASARAAGAPAWFPSAPLANATDPFVPRVAESARGDALFAWVTKDGPSSHAIAVAGLLAGPGTPIVTTRSRGAALSDAGVYPPALALSATGDALVAWKEGPVSLGLRLRQAPGDFGEPQIRNATPGMNAIHDFIESPVAAGADASGHFTIAYGAELPTPYSPTGNLDRLVIWSVDANNGLISGPSQVGPTTTPSDTYPITDIALAVAPDGGAVVAYRQYVAGSNTLKVSTRDGAAGAWSSPYVLDFSGDQPRVAITSGGRAVVAWRHVPEVPGDTFQVRAQERPPAGSFTPVSSDSLGTLSDASLPSGEANVALDGSGRGTVLWETCTGCGAPGASRTVLSQALKPDGTLDGTVQTLSGQSPDPNFMNPQVAITPSGIAVAVWKRTVSGHSILEYARRPGPGVPFSSAAAVPADPEVSTPGIDAGPEIAVDAAGDAAVAWEQNNGTGVAVPHVARLDAAPPIAGPITLSGGPPAPFVPLIFHVAPRDAVSATTVRWSFGDGTPVSTGTTVRHIFRVGGNRTVTATVTDGAGFSTVVKRTVTLGGGGSPPRFSGTLGAVTVRFRHRVVGARIRWRLSVAASVRISLVRLDAGRRLHGKCRPRARGGRRCTVMTPVTTRTVAARAGPGSVTLKLPPGRYRATLVAGSGSGRSAPAQVTFRV